MERKLIYDQFLCGAICGTCNHGWMSQLDAQFTQFLEVLSSPARPLSSLTDAQKSLAAHWATKTAMVLSDTIQPAIAAIPGRHASHYFSTKEFPDSFIILAARSDDTAAGFRFSFCPSWVVEADESSGDCPQIGYNGAYKVFMQLRDIMFLVCHYPVFHAKFLLAENSALVLASTPLHVSSAPSLPDTLPGPFAFSMAVAVRLPALEKALNPPASSTCYCGSGETFGSCCRIT
ncbi:MAG: hypothetical protein HC869_08755 [Rhodospirillales bacterium]|nr:hypothetical protein [Rhodospirillales bacterium]